MAKIKITATTVSEVMELAIPNRTTFYFDDDLTGFGFYRTPGNVGTFFAEFRSVAGGSKKRVKLGRVGTLKANEARDAARLAIANAALGKDLAKDRADERASMTVTRLVQCYIDEHVATKRKSADYYRDILRVHISPNIGNVRAAALTRTEVQRMHTVASKRGKYAANRAVAILSAAYGWGIKHGHVKEGFNPATRIDKNSERSRERFLSVEEIKCIGEALHEAETSGLPYDVDIAGLMAKHAPKPEKRRTVFSPHVTGAIRLLMLTGMRLREVLNLRWDEVDTERGIAFLPDSKTGAKAVVLAPAALTVIANLPRVGGFVIASDSAGTKTEKPRADLKRPWRAICKRAGLTGVRIHDLRHSFASVGAEAWSLPVIGSLLGHSNASTTKRYAKIADSAARRAADHIANRIAAAMECE